MKLIATSPRVGVIVEGEIPSNSTIPRTGEYLAYRNVDLKFTVQSVTWYYGPTEVHIVTD